MKKCKKGFTLVELVVVVAIIAVLSAVSVAAYNGITERATLNTDENVCGQMNDALTSNNTLTGPAENVNKAKTYLANEGLKEASFVPGSVNHFYYWNQNDTKIYLVNTETDFDVVYPTENEAEVEAQYAEKPYKFYRLDFTYYSISYDEGLYGDEDNVTALEANKSATLSVYSTDDTIESIKAVGADYVFDESATNPFKITISNPTGDITIEGEACILKGSLIQLANGETKKVEDLTLSDQIMCYDYYTGTIAPTRLLCLTKGHSKKMPVISITLDNGNSIQIADYENIFDMETREYWCIDTTNYTEAVGKTVMVNDNGSIGSAKVVSSNLEIIEAEYYTVSPEKTNYIANNIVMSNNSPLCKYFTPIDEDYKFDEVEYNKIVEKYGQYSYSEFSDIICEEWFYSQRVNDYKIIEGMGLSTKDRIIKFVKNMVNLYNSNIAPLY